MARTEIFFFPFSIFLFWQPLIINSANVFNIGNETRCVLDRYSVSFHKLKILKDVNFVVTKAVLMCQGFVVSYFLISFSAILK